MTGHQGPRPKYWAFYPKDFFADGSVLELTGPEKAAYLLLLAWAWERGAVLADPARALSALGYDGAAADQLWGSLAHLFERCPAGWAQRRQAEDYEEAAEKRRALRKRAKKGAEGRWGKASEEPDSNACGNACGMPAEMLVASNKQCPPSPSPSPSPSPEASPAAGDQNPDARERAGEGATFREAKRSKGKLHRWRALKLAKYPQLCEGPLADELAPWEDHLEQRMPRAYTQTGADRLLAKIARMTPKQLRDAVEFSAAGNYQALVSPGASRASNGTTALERLEAMERDFELDRSDPRDVEPDEA